MPIIVSSTIDFAFSEDYEAETGKGYYFHRYPEKGESVDWSTYKDTSQSFATIGEADCAYRAGDLEWS